MRLLIVSRRFPPDQHSGTETVISELVKRAAEEAEVRLVAGWVHSPRAFPEFAAPVRLRGMPRAAAWLTLAAAARREARRFRPDVVLANSIETPPDLAPTAAIVYDFNFGAAGRRRLAALRERFYRRRSRQLAAVVVISEATRARAAARGFETARMVVIHPGVDLDRFRPPRRRAPGPPRLVVPSRILPGKGQHLAIEAFRRLDGPRDAELVVAGSVADRGYLESLRRRAAGLRVRFHTDVDDMAAELRAADVVLFPTLMDEGFGYAAAEGMACGRPVVHFRNRAVDEACAGHAVAVPPGHVDAMSRAVAELLADGDRRRRLGREGRRHVEASFGWDRIWERYREVLWGLAR